jgi:hypothetical protein
LHSCNLFNPQAGANGAKILHRQCLPFNAFNSSRSALFIFIKISGTNLLTNALLFLDCFLGSCGGKLDCGGFVLIGALVVVASTDVGGSDKGELIFCR